MIAITWCEWRHRYQQFPLAIAMSLSRSLGVNGPYKYGPIQHLSSFCSNINMPVFFTNVGNLCLASPKREIQEQPQINSNLLKIIVEIELELIPVRLLKNGSLAKTFSKGFRSRGSISSSMENVQLCSSWNLLAASQSRRQSLINMNEKHSPL